MKKKLIVKIGTSTLTAGTNRISFAVIENLARQIVELKNEYDIVIVSSVPLLPPANLWKSTDTTNMWIPSRQWRPLDKRGSWSYTIRSSAVLA